MAASATETYRIIIGLSGLAQLLTPGKHFFTWVLRMTPCGASMSKSCPTSKYIKAAELPACASLVGVGDGRVELELEFVDGEMGSSDFSSVPLSASVFSDGVHDE